MITTLGAAASKAINVESLEKARRRSKEKRRMMIGFRFICMDGLQSSYRQWSETVNRSPPFSFQFCTRLAAVFAEEAGGFGFIFCPI